MSDAALECLREAGRVAAAARELGLAQIRPGASLREVCEAVEDEIRRRGAGLAFPVQSSRNQVAAHYCPSPEDASVYAAGDVAKLDIGVHVDGWVVDTAATVSVGGDPAGQALVDAARAALEAAIAEAGPGVAVGRLAASIESAIRSAGYRPMRNLCGHGVGRWTVHGPPPIPNVSLPATDRAKLAEGAVVAIEPFATDGQGFVVERGEAEVFRLDPARDRGAPGDEVHEAIRAFRGLPFARRQLSGFPRERVERTLSALRNEGLVAYAPLVEAGGRPVAQAEHTIRVGADGVEVLTR